MASCVATITKAYKDMGFSIISIDDPFLSQIVGMRKTLYHEPEFILATLNEAAKYLEAEGSLHVCGILSPKLRDLLLDSTIHHLDHEFKTAPRNIDLFDREMLEDHGKILAFGSVQTNPVPIPGKEDIDNYVEPVEELVAHMTIAKERYGEENILIKPDCGFGGMVAFDRIQPGFGHEIVMKKLQNMVAAAKEVFG
jgi:methionine synthase II (cobalamin-independent)